MTQISKLPSRLLWKAIFVPTAVPLPVAGAVTRQIAKSDARTETEPARYPVSFSRACQMTLPRAEVTVKHRGPLLAPRDAVEPAAPVVRDPYGSVRRCEPVDVEPARRPRDRRDRPARRRHPHERVHRREAGRIDCGAPGRDEEIVAGRDEIDPARADLDRSQRAVRRVQLQQVGAAPGDPE